MPPRTMTCFASSWSFKPTPLDPPRPLRDLFWTRLGRGLDGVFCHFPAPPSPQPQSPQPLPQNPVPRENFFCSDGIRAHHFTKQTQLPLRALRGSAVSIPPLSGYKTNPPSACIRVHPDSHRSRAHSKSAFALVTVHPQ